MPKHWGTIAASTTKSPRERLEEAVAAGPLSQAERNTFRSQLAAVVAQDNARRAAPSPQAALELDKAA